MGRASEPGGTTQDSLLELALGAQEAWIVEYSRTVSEDENTIKESRNRLRQLLASNQRRLQAWKAQAPHDPELQKQIKRHDAAVAIAHTVAAESRDGLRGRLYFMPLLEPIHRFHVDKWEAPPLDQAPIQMGFVTAD